MEFPSEPLRSVGRTAAGCRIVIALVLIWGWAGPVAASQPSGSLPVSGVVQHLVTGYDRSKTFISVIIGRDFEEPLPRGVASIEIQGPQGKLPLSLSNFRYVRRKREFWAVLDGVPPKGRYRITVTGNGLKGVVERSLTRLRRLPVPEGLECQVDRDGLVSVNRPVFRWKVGKHPEGLFHQLQIKNSNGRIIYQSRILPNIGSHRPERNILRPGREYLWRVRTYDGNKWALAQNRSQTIWSSLEVGQKLNYVYTQPPVTDDGWDQGDLRSAGLETGPLVELLERVLSETDKEVHGVLLALDGKLVLEEYFNGYGRDNLQLLASVTKSINSILFGQAVDLGLIKDLDRPALEYFPEYSQVPDFESKRKITLRHLLTMSAGLDWDYTTLPIESPDYPTRKMVTSDDPLGFLLNRKMVAQPGQTYNYNDGLSIMLGEILRRVSDQPVGRFAKARLFAPLGIQRFFWNTTRAGLTMTQGGLYLRPRDMAKIGQLVLQGGVWRGRRIVSQEWLRDSTREHLSGDGVGYGYQWRTAKVKQGGRELTIIWASGYGGQRIFIVPDLEAVAVITHKVLHNPGGGLRAERMFVNRILPALVPGEKPARQEVGLPPDAAKLAGCYRSDTGYATGCVTLEKGRLFLTLKTNYLEEKCGLKPVSETELVGVSKLMGRFRIIMDRSGAGDLDKAVFKFGLRRKVMRRVQ